LPLIFEFPYSRCISSIFFRRFYPNFSSLFIPVYPRHSRIGLNQRHSTRSLDSVQNPCHTERHTTLSYTFFEKQIFKNFFGPFPGTPGAFAPHFRISLLPLHILKFLPTFRPLFSLPSSWSFHPSTSWSSQYLL